MMLKHVPLGGTLLLVHAAINEGDHEEPEPVGATEG